MNLSINSAYSKPVIQKKNVSFGDFRHCELKYKSEKITPETKNLLDQALDIHEKKQKNVENSIKNFYNDFLIKDKIAVQTYNNAIRYMQLRTDTNVFKGYSFMPSYEAVMENGKTKRGYVLGAGRETNTFDIVIAGDEVGMNPRQYNYMNENAPGYDLNKDAQNRLKKIIKTHSEETQQ